MFTEEGTKVEVATREILGSMVLQRIETMCSPDTRIIRVISRFEDGKVCPFSTKVYAASVRHRDRWHLGAISGMGQLSKCATMAESSRTYNFTGASSLPAIVFFFFFFFVFFFFFFLTLPPRLPLNVRQMIYTRGFTARRIL